MIVTGVSSGLAGFGVGCGNGSGFGCGSGAGAVIPASVWRRRDPFAGFEREKQPRSLTEEPHGRGHGVIPSVARDLGRGGMISPRSRSLVASLLGMTNCLGMTKRCEGATIRRQTHHTT